MSIVLVAGIAARLTYPQSMHEWIDRDIQRTIGLVSGTHFPLVGPEANSGGFLPGPFFYLLLAPVYLFTRSPYAAGYFNSALNIASLIFFFLVIRRRYSPFCTLVATGLLSFSLMHASSFGSPINPSFLFILNTLMIWFFLKIFIDEKDVYWIPAALTIALGCQIHLSILIYAFSLAALSIFTLRPRIRVVVLSILGGLLCFVPYLTYLLITQNVALYRFYREVSRSSSLAELLPLDTFGRIFTTHPLETTYQRLTEFIQGISPGVVLSYIRAVTGIEALFFLTASLCGAAMFVLWGYRSRFRFTGTRRLRILPFLAIVPLLLVWQWTGISRHGHHWYSYVFFPLIPFWIAVSLDAVASRIRPRFQRVFQGSVLASVVFLAPNTITFHKTAFFLLDDAVKDVREVKQELGFSVERYRENVFFVDRLPHSGPENNSPPFEPPSWGLYTDYLYDTVTTDIPSRESDPERCYLVAHKPMVDFHSRDNYLKEIRSFLAIDPTGTREATRLVFFEYPRPRHGNCFHNTLNAWVINERMGRTVAKIPAGSQSTLLKKEEQNDPSGRWVRQDLEFAIFDRQSSLPMVIRLSFRRDRKGISWQAALDSGQLMGHLNTMTAYAGLYRPWPKLWLEDLRLVLQADGVSETLSFSDGEIGRFMLAPLRSVPAPLSRDPDGKPLELSLSYKTIASGSYASAGSDIQNLVRSEGEVRSWETTQLLYEGTL